MRILNALVLAFWFGCGVTLIAIAAPAAFRHSRDAVAAANVVGAMLDVWHWIAVLSPLLLLLTIRGSRLRTGLIAAALILALGQVAADDRIHQLRNQSPVPISALPKDNALRRQFGAMHGASSLLMLLEVIAAAAVLATAARDRDQTIG